MIQKSKNFFQEATQLVSLDCSSINGQNHLSRNISQSLHQSLLNLKIVLPTFTSEFLLFKEEIIEMSYFIVNKLMSVIKTKTFIISQLNEQLSKSQSLNDTMKKEVIQLKEMVTNAMESLRKQITEKDKEIAVKDNEVQALKFFLKEKFSSPGSRFTNCEQSITQICFKGEATPNLRISNAPVEEDLGFNNFLQSFQNQLEEPLIQMSESITVTAEQLTKKASLQIIQEESSQSTSLTDYLQSQRFSQKGNIDKSKNELLRSARSIDNKPKPSSCTVLEPILQQQNKPKNFYLQTCQNISNGNGAVQDSRNLVPRIPMQRLNTNWCCRDSFSSRTINNQHNNQNTKLLLQRQRRGSQSIYFNANVGYDSIGYDNNGPDSIGYDNVVCDNVGYDNVGYDNYKIERKHKEATAFRKKSFDPINSHQKTEEISKQRTLRAKLEQLSKSSSYSDINKLGDSDKICVNLPNIFQSPKKINFLKKNQLFNQEKLKTEPSPRDHSNQMNKENINIEFQFKPLDMGRKILARKKMIMAHSKATTARINSKKVAETNDSVRKPEEPLKNQLFPIEIKFIESPKKQALKSSHRLKPSVATVFSATAFKQQTLRVNSYMNYSSGSSRISNINELTSKQHHLYHSTGNYQQSTPKKVTKVFMTPGKSQPQLLIDKKSKSKSKQKLRVYSKLCQRSCANALLNSIATNERLALEAIQPTLTVNKVHQVAVKVKAKNPSVYLGSNTKPYFRKNLLQIKNGLIDFNLAQALRRLREVHFSGLMINGLRQGPGQIIYSNGLMYEGSFQAGKKQGLGKFILNGVEIFQGKFTRDLIEGQGYLKFFKYFSCANYTCPKVLQNASYSGRLSKSSFDGMGTLFIKQNEKIVTKFCQGVPFGDLTLYTENDIQFGHWPIQQTKFG